MPGFRHCSWCHGNGCICCDAEEKKWNERQAKRQADREAEYDRLFPNGPTPIFTARRGDADDMTSIKRILNAAMNPDGIAEAPSIVGQALSQLGASPDERAAIERQFSAPEAAEKVAEIERFFQRHRPDAPKYEPIGNGSGVINAEPPADPNPET